MKIKYILLIAALAALSAASSFGGPISGKLVVKFAPGSPQADLSKNNDSLFFEEFIEIIGLHGAGSFIDISLINHAQRKFSRAENSAVQSIGQREDLFAEGLIRIALINYEGKISPETAASKISSFPFVEYAEPLYERSFYFSPNDTLIKDQYYLGLIEVFEAWPLLETNDTLIIGIVDTGIDAGHVEFDGIIWRNPGESGFDGDGKDKSSNGIDDDNNGFVDDWQGWDFVSSSESGQDNEPFPGNGHGTHVAGIAGAISGNTAGIAGVAKNVKLLPVKIGSDSPFSTSVYNGYEGILYAAANGARVINCSWGGPNRSQAEQEVIDAAVQMGALIIAAAGNDGDDARHYPAGYDGVMSVASTNRNDEVSLFSNYHITTDISAPGANILSTLPGNNYEYLNGTSMATPVVAGTAAMVLLKNPGLGPLQAIEWLKATSDNIDSINPGYAKKIGRGRVNAKNALTAVSLKATVLNSYEITDENGDGLLDSDEKIELSVSVQNILDGLSSATAKIAPFGETELDFLINEAFIGELQSGQKAFLENAFVFNIPENTPADLPQILEIEIYDGDEYVNSLYIEIILRPSYRNMDGNNLAVTLNSKGNFAFNDYPSNTQGIGLAYKGGPNILFEGALMIGVNSIKISNSARGSYQRKQDGSFSSGNIFNIVKPGQRAAQEGYAWFTDGNGNPENAGVAIEQKAYQFNKSGYEDFIIIHYDIENISNLDFEGMYAALYFDWDIGPSGRSNTAYFNFEDSTGHMANTADSSLPMAGCALLSGQPVNFFAIDNPGETEENPGVYDGFTKSEKWLMMSGGIGRGRSDTLDASFVFGAGPISLESGAKTRVSFAIFAADSLAGLIEAAENSRRAFLLTGVAEMQDISRDIWLFPNPVLANALIRVNIERAGHYDIRINSLTGRRLPGLIERAYLAGGQNDIDLDLSALPPGAYIIEIGNNHLSREIKFIKK